MSRRYSDPLDLIWLSTAERLGMTVKRSSEVFASWDGDQVLTISTPEGFDPDDCLAQMILHELCHALVQGPGGLRRPDWGLENVDSRDLVREYACHRLQAALLDRHGLRTMLAPTTEHRPYYEALPADPLAPGDDPAIPLAREGWLRATQGDWSAEIEAALRATAALAKVTRAFSPGEEIWAHSALPHPSGLPPGVDGSTCADCAWYRPERCLKAERPVPHDSPGCRFHQPALTLESCLDCGACCREGFHQVPIEPDDAVTQLHPEWVVRDEWGLHLPRPGGRCPALSGPPFHCSIYVDRPRNCRDLEPGSKGCLEARQRVGLS